MNRNECIDFLRGYFVIEGLDKIDLEKLERENGVLRAVLDPHEKEPIEYINTIGMEDYNIYVEYETSVPFETNRLYLDDIPTDILEYLVNSIQEMEVMGY